MCRIAIIFLLQRLKESMSDARDFDNIDTRAVVMVFVFPAGQGAEGDSHLLIETLGEHSPSYATVKNWVAQFKRGEISTCNAPRPG
jgi:hypothetical protein